MDSFNENIPNLAVNYNSYYDSRDI